MKRLSIKGRVTLWYTVLMVILVILVLVFMFSVSDTMIETSARNDLKSQVTKSADEIEYDDGKLEIDDDVDYLSHGIYILIYDADGSLIDGKMPDGFATGTVLEDGDTKTVEIDGEPYYVYDVRLTFDSHEDVWVRGITAVSDSAAAMDTMLNIAFISLPFLVILAAAGGYWITKRAFRPVEQIRAAADRIGEGHDLSRRIHLTGGKDEIYALAATFDSMFDRLQRSFEAEKQLTADASHELRTPVTVITAQCEYVMEHAKSEEEMKDAFAVILRQAQKMSGLISQMLTLARADRGLEKLHPEAFNLSEMVDIIADEQRAAAQEKDISITTEIEPDIIVKADHTMIARLVINLLSNAIQYGSPKGFAHITLRRSDDRVTLQVRDNGAGISAEHLPKIWDRFYRADASRTGGGGAGLGLAMVKWIAEAHGGYVSVESAPGLGSTFTFSFPSGHNILVTL